MHDSPAPLPESEPERAKGEMAMLETLAKSRAEDLKFADAKAGVIITLSSAIAAGAFTFARHWALAESLHPRLLTLAAILFAAGCFCAGTAIYAAIQAVRPRVDGLKELDKLFVMGGQFKRPPKSTERLLGPFDRLSVPFAVLFASPKDFLAALDFTAGARSLLLAEHCLRMARNAYVKYHYVHAAATLVAIEVLCFLVAGMMALRAGLAP